jgi:hypothetical protein
VKSARIDRHKNIGATLTHRGKHLSPCRKNFGKKGQYPSNANRSKAAGIDKDIYTRSGHRCTAYPPDACIWEKVLKTPGELACDFVTAGFTGCDGYLHLFASAAWSIILAAS